MADKTNINKSINSQTTTKSIRKIFNTIIKYPIFFLLNAIPIYIISTLGLGYRWTLLYSDNADNINSVLLNLSYSYVAALFFYILHDYIPTKRNEFKSFLIIKPQLKEIIRMSEELIGLLLMVYEIKKDRTILTIEDLVSCTHYEPNFEKTYYQEYLISNGVNKKSHKGVFDFWGDLEEYSNKINKKIAIIKKSPSFRYIDSNLIVLISKFEQNELLKTHLQISQYPLLNNESREIYDFPQKIYDFNNICLKLKKEMNIDEILRYEKLSKNEKEEMDVVRARFMRKLKESGRIKDKALIYFNNIEYKIRNGKLI